MKHLLETPHSLQTIAAQWFKYFSLLSGKMPNDPIPKKIGTYTLLTEQSSPNTASPYKTGIYVSSKKKVFIKTWIGALKDTHYYNLVGEYNMAQVLNKKLKELNVNHTFSFSVPLQFIQTRNSISVVFEYVNGKRLDLFPIKKQIAVVEESISLLGMVTNRLTKSEKKVFKKRTFFQFALIFPALSILFVFKTPSRIFKVAGLFLPTLFGLVSQFNSRLSLAHRDLSVSNIVIEKNKVHIFDIENMVLTDPLYDEISWYLDPLGHNVWKKFTYKHDSIQSYPLTLCLILYLSVFTYNIPHKFEHTITLFDSWI